MIRWLLVCLTWGHKWIPGVVRDRDGEPRACYFCERCKTIKGQDRFNDLIG